MESVHYLVLHVKIAMLNTYIRLNEKLKIDLITNQGFLFYKLPTWLVNV